MTAPMSARNLPVAPDITVLVVTFNRAGSLARALLSLLKQETRGAFRYEILVVDDGSTDETPEVVAAAARQAGPVPLRYVRQENRGISAARNVGLRLASGEWVAFCDDDEVAASTWLWELWRMAQETGAPCVGGRVVLALPPEVLSALGPRARRVLGESQSRDWQLPSPDGLTTGNVMFRRSLCESLGGFSEVLRRDHDTDFFWRLGQAGFALAVAPKAITYHVLSCDRWQEGSMKRINLMQGVADAGLVLKYAGLPRLALALLRRLVVVLLWDLPGLLRTWMLGDRCRRLESLLGLWYAQGLWRGALFWMFPAIFPQSRFIQDSGLFFPQPGQDHLTLRRRFLRETPHV
ncbi:MAG: glycosyltransferase family A protein [Desulfobaccales bacterium]